MFERLGIQGLFIEVFRKKIFCLEKVVKKANKCGGRQLSVLLRKLDMGPQYQFKVFYNEVD